MSEAAAEPGFARLLSDERLTRRAVGGDERAFAAIFRRYHQPLYRFCLAIVGNAEDAQDALQNTMIKVLRALPGEERRIELKPWLYRIAHNESIDLLRRRRETRELSVEQAAPGYGLAEDAATRERLRRLLADLRELPVRQREVLVMRELGGLDFEEIGSALDTSGAVARQTLYEARQSLRQMEEGREMSCEAVTQALSDGDGRVTRRRDVRAHLRSCPGCRAFRDEIKSRQNDLAALSPLPAIAAAGILHGLAGGSAGSAVGGGLAATLGGGAAKTIGASAAAKGLATAAVVAAVGVTAADRTGVIHLGLPGEGDAKPAKAAPVAPAHSHGDGSQGSAGGAGMEGGREADGGQGKGVQNAQAHGQEAPAAGTGAAHRADPAKGHGNGRDQGNGHGGSQAQGPAVEHPHGQGHEKQHPEAATGGQETAAEEKPPPIESSGGNEEGGGAGTGDGGDPGSGKAVTPPAPAKPPPVTPAPSTPTPTAPAPPEEAPANPLGAAPEPPGRSEGSAKAAPAPAPAPDPPVSPERGPRTDTPSPSR
jgi:RNA polymerase sigma factor (sigma-70 family)